MFAGVFFDHCSQKEIKNLPTRKLDLEFLKEVVLGKDFKDLPEADWVPRKKVVLDAYSKFTAAKTSFDPTVSDLETLLGDLFDNVDDEGMADALEVMTDMVVGDFGVLGNIESCADEQIAAESELIDIVCEDYEFSEVEQALFVVDYFEKMFENLVKKEMRISNDELKNGVAQAEISEAGKNGRLKRMVSRNEKNDILLTSALGCAPLKKVIVDAVEEEYADLNDPADDSGDAAMGVSFSSAIAVRTARTNNEILKMAEELDDFDAGGWVDAAIETAGSSRRPGAKRRNSSRQLRPKILIA
jgi:hypothetical protein